MNITEFGGLAIVGTLIATGWSHIKLIFEKLKSVLILSQEFKCNSCAVIQHYLNTNHLKNKNSNNQTFVAASLLDSEGNRKIVGLKTALNYDQYKLVWIDKIPILFYKGKLEPSLGIYVSERIFVSYIKYTFDVEKFF